jgi:hypothetical protein
LHERLTPYLKGEEEQVAKFLKLCFYVQGDVSCSAIQPEMHLVYLLEAAARCSALCSVQHSGLQQQQQCGNALLTHP